MAQQWNDLVYRFPQGQGPALQQKAPRLQSGVGRGLLSDPGIKGMFNGGNSQDGINRMFGGQAAPVRPQPMQQPSRFDNRMQSLQQQQGQIQNEIQRRGGAENATGFAQQLGGVQDRLATMQNQQHNMQNPQYQQMMNQRNQLQNEIHRRGGMANAAGFAQQYNDLNQQMRGIRNAPAAPMSPAGNVPETGGPSFVGNEQAPAYNAPQAAQPAPSAQPMSQRDPAQVAARQAQRQAYLQRVGR